MFVEPEKVFMTPKINQRIQIHKIVQRSANTEVFYVEFFYTASNKTPFLLSIVVSSRFGHIYFIFCAMIAFKYTYRVKTSLVKWLSVPL